MSPDSPWVASHPPASTVPLSLVPSANLKVHLTPLSVTGMKILNNSPSCLIAALVVPHVPQEVTTGRWLCAGSPAPKLCLCSSFPMSHRNVCSAYSLYNPLAAWPNELTSHCYISLEFCQRTKDQGQGGLRQTKSGAWVDRGRGKVGEELERKC